MMVHTCHAVYVCGVYGGGAEALDLYTSTSTCIKYAHSIALTSAPRAQRNETTRSRGDREEEKHPSRNHIGEQRREQRD